MSTRLTLSFYAENSRVFNISVPHSKRASTLTKQILGDSMDKILATDAIITEHGSLVKKKRAVITETKSITLL